MFRRSTIATTLFAASLGLAVGMVPAFADNDKGDNSRGNSGNGQGESRHDQTGSGTTASHHDEGDRAGGNSEGDGKRSDDRKSDDRNRDRNWDDRRDDNGSIASELKWMNASQASKSALAHASSKSRVGKNAAYAAAVKATAAADSQLQTVLAADDVAKANLATARAALQADLAAGTDTSAAKAQVVAAEAAVDTANGNFSDAQLGYFDALVAQRKALRQVTGSRPVWEDTLDRFRRNLGL